MPKLKTALLIVTVSLILFGSLNFAFAVSYDEDPEGWLREQCEFFVDLGFWDECWTCYDDEGKICICIGGYQPCHWDSKEDCEEHSSPTSTCVLFYSGEGENGGDDGEEEEEPECNLDELNKGKTFTLAKGNPATGETTFEEGLSYEHILSTERQEDRKEGTGLRDWFVEQLLTEDSPFRRFAEGLAEFGSDGEFVSVFEYGNDTDAFFEKVVQAEGKEPRSDACSCHHSELGMIEDIYSIAAEAVPGGGGLGSSQTLESLLERGDGLCREQAALLNSALQRRNINSEIVRGSDHAWVRINLPAKEGCESLEFDLDLMWYKNIVYLPPRR